EEDRPHVAVEHLVIDGGILRLERCTPFLEAGIVEGDIEPAVAVDRGSDEAFDLILTPDICLDPKRLHAEVAARSSNCFDLALAPSGDQHCTRALFGHFQSRRAANAATAPGHQADLASH